MFLSSQGIRQQAAMRWIHAGYLMQPWLYMCPPAFCAFLDMCALIVVM